MSPIFVRVYSVTGDKVATLLVDETCLKLSSNDYNSVDDFNEGWDKKLSLANKTDIPYHKIKSIVTEQVDTTIKVNYKKMVGLPSEVSFSFKQEDEREDFFQTLEKKLFFTKQIIQLTVFRAIVWYCVGALATIGFTYFCYDIAIKLQLRDNSTLKSYNNSNGKSKLLYLLLEKIGPYPTLAIGVVILFFVIKKIVSRIKQKPIQIRFTPVSV